MLIGIWYIKFHLFCNEVIACLFIVQFYLFPNMQEANVCFCKKAFVNSFQDIWEKNTKFHPLKVLFYMVLERLFLVIEKLLIFFLRKNIGKINILF